MRKRKLSVGIASVALLSVTAGCSDSPGTSAATGAAPAPSTSAATLPATAPSADGGAPGAPASPDAAAGAGAPASPGAPAGPNGGSGEATAAPAGKQQPDRCHTAQLRAVLHPFTFPGHAGSEAVAELGLTNTGGAPCVITGYPGLQLIGADGRPRPTTVGRNNAESKRLVTLASGATAWSLIAWRFIPNPDEEKTSPLCGGKMTTIKVIPPDETTQLTATADIGTVCQRGRLDTAPFQEARPSERRTPR